MENLRRQYNDNVQKFKADFADCSDFLLKEAETGGRKCFFAVMDGLVDSLQLGQMIMGPVLGAQVKPDGTLSLQLQYRMELALEQYRAAGFIGPAQIFLLAGQISALLFLHRAEMRAGFVAPLAVRMTVLLAWKHGKTRSFRWIR